MEKSKAILGLMDSEVLERKEKGQINIIENKNIKTNWEIIKGNLFTLFNFYNLLIAIALILVGAYSNLAFMLIIALNVSMGN